MKKEQKLSNYEAPKVEVIEVEVEKGFAVSPGGNGEGMNPGNGGW